MKVFIWADPYDVYYGSSLLFVAAKNLDQAKELAKKGKAYSYGQYENDRHNNNQRS